MLSCNDQDRQSFSQSFLCKRKEDELHIPVTSFTKSIQFQLQNYNLHDTTVYTERIDTTIHELLHPATIHRVPNTQPLLCLFTLRAHSELFFLLRSSFYSLLN